MNIEDIVKNFRDVGVSVNGLAGESLFPEGVLYRGGRIISVFSHDELLNIPTILNLRTGKDDKKFNCKYLHVPAEDKLENYETSHGKIKKWVNKVLGEIAKENVPLPIFIHCTSGKDRTGVITAVILKLLDIPDEIIIKEYLLSDGVEGAKPIKIALEGVGNINQYIKKPVAKNLINKLKKCQ